MSEIVVANVFFSSDKQTGLVGGASNTFSLNVDNNQVLVVNSSTFSVKTGNTTTEIKTLIQIYSLAF
jgi:pyridoxal/pyridoxine/pyridoxamine kinase